MEIERDKLMEIVERYRLLAANAQGAASNAVMPDQYRNAYRKMAKHWSELAAELEECLGWPNDTLH